MTTLRVLGHVVDQFGVYPDPDKLAAVKEFSIPLNVISLQNFIGLHFYHRKYIKKFYRNFQTPFNSDKVIVTILMWTR